MKRFGLIVLAMIVIVANLVPLMATAEESKAIELYTYEDLLQIKDNPTGNYELKADIDAAGETWVPIAFSGTLNGNGFAIMNLKIESLGSEVRTSIDGNWKEYDTYYAGFFSTLENASVSDLSLLGISVDVTTDKDSYVGGLAGYMADSTVKNCTIDGTLSLTTDCKSFGVGGIIGYGWGSLDTCTANVTLIAIDENTTYKEEQFMGGAYSNGYIDAVNCTINIDGYDSDHGYVHNGGLAGMYILPTGVTYAGNISNNTVTGSIHFFEDNTDRRAYCKGLIGEIMRSTFTNKGNNVEEFVRDEIKVYTENLLPESCDDAEYEKTVVEPTSTEYGYTLYECKTCDYSYKSDYTSLNIYVEPETTTAVEEVTETSTSTLNLSEKIPYIVVAAVIIVGIFVAIVMLNKIR